MAHGSGISATPDGSGGIVLGGCDSGGVQRGLQRWSVQVAVDAAEPLAGLVIPAATQHSTIWPSRQHLTLAA